MTSAKRASNKWANLRIPPEDRVALSRRVWSAVKKQLGLTDAQMWSCFNKAVVIRVRVPKRGCER